MVAKVRTEAVFVGRSPRAQQQSVTDIFHYQKLFEHILYKEGAGLAQAVQCLTTGWATGVRFPAGAKDFSSSLFVQTGSGAHPASCTMGTGGHFSGGKARPGSDADHSPPSSAEVVNE
jgi:hypothetical protein